MDQKVCLDTDVCVEILKNTDKGIEFINLINKSEVFITTISIFELFLRETNIFSIEKFLSKINILDFSELSAKKASEIFKDLRKEGKIIDVRDLFIASTTIVNNCVLATSNKKHFKNIKDLKLL